MRSVGKTVVVASALFGACTPSKDATVARPHAATTVAAVEFERVAPARDMGPVELSRSTCATKIRETRGDREFILARSEEVQQAIDPDSTMRLTKAEAVYIPATYRFSKASEILEAVKVLDVDSVHIDCRTMTRM